MSRNASRKRASGARSVVVDSNPGVIVTGDNARILASKPQQIGRYPKRVVLGEIPRCPPAFQARADLYRQLINARSPASVSTLAGGRGTGKTQLAAAYARKCINDGWALVAWIGAEHSDQILSGLEQLSRVIGLHDDDDDSASAAGKVRRWLESSGGKRCLIVFDNATDPDALSHWLPAAGSARIVITSSRRSFESFGALIDVEAFNPEEARAYLHECTGHDDDVGAGALAEEVGRLPLALAQAAALVRIKHLSYSELLDRIRRIPLGAFLKRRPGDAYPRGATETVLLSIEQAEGHGRLTRSLLLLLSVLSPDGVDRTLLYSAPMGTGLIGFLLGVDRQASPTEIDETIDRLVEASLATVSVNGQTVIMHRFTQRVIRERADSVRIYAPALLRAAKVVAKQCNLAGSNQEGQATPEDLIRQISALWDNAAIESKEDIDNFAQMPGRMGRWAGRKFAILLMDLRRWSVGRLGETHNAARAIELGTVVVGECETLLGPEHPTTLSIRSNLATAYLDREQLDEAIELNQQTLTDRERILGPDHRDTLISRSNLASAYRHAGLYDKAIQLHQKTIVDQERRLGSDHNDTLTSRNNLALAYEAVGQLDEAIDLHQQTLTDHLRVLGPDHLSTLISRNNLAAAYEAAGRTRRGHRLAPADPH